MPRIYDTILKPDGQRYENHELYERIIDDVGHLGNDVQGMQSGYAGLNNYSDIAKRYGLNLDGVDAGIDAKFRGAKRNLASLLGKSRASMATRTGAGTGVPEAGMNQLEGQFAGAAGNIESAQAGEKVAAEQDMKVRIAQFLQNALGSQDAFGLNKNSLYARVLGQRQGLMKDYMQRGDYNEQKEGSFWDDLGTGLDLAGKALSLGTKVVGLF